MGLKTKYRHLTRFKDIANVLTRHGFAHLLKQIGLSEFFTKNGGEVKHDLTTAERARKVLEELGPTFVKLGQMLSTRPDILPPEFSEELEKLQDQVQPLPFDVIKEVLEKNLGEPINKVFRQLDEIPLASASIGQVYRGILRSGEEVVVKIKRPGVDEIIEKDLEIIFDFARLLENTSWGRFYQVMDIAEEFGRSIMAEIDYNIEGRNADKFRENFRDDTSVYFPKIFWEHSSRNILVMEYIDGVKISDFKALEARGYSKSNLARKTVEALLKQILIHGFFHADPHPGNLAVLPSEQVAFMDFGQVGRLDDVTKDQLINLLLAVVRQDVSGMTDALTDIGRIRSKVNKTSLRKDIKYLFDRYYGMPLSQIQLGEAIQELLRLATQYRIVIPSEVALLSKALITLEGLIHRLDPHISIVDLAEPFGKLVIRERYSPAKLKKTLYRNLVEFLRVAHKLPRQMENIADTLSEGEFKIKLEHRHLDKLLQRLTLVSNRLSFSIIIAAIIIGSSLIAREAKYTLLLRFPIAEIGFLTATLMGIGLLISIIRSGRL